MPDCGGMTVYVYYGVIVGGGRMGGNILINSMIVMENYPPIFQLEKVVVYPVGLHSFLLEFTHDGYLQFSGPVSRKVTICPSCYNTAALRQLGYQTS